MYLPCSSPDFSDDELDQRIKSSTDISTDTNTDTKTDTDQYQHSTRLPPGMTRADVSKHAHTHACTHVVLQITGYIYATKSK